MLDAKNWELVIMTGYTYEFEHVYYPNVTIKIFAKSEEDAWNKLKALN